MQENLAQQLRHTHPCFAHTLQIGLVDFRFEQAFDKREENFGENGGPFLVVCGGEFGGLEGALKAGEGAAADGTVRVFALHAEAFKDGGPVGYPGFVPFKVGLGDEGGDAGGQLVDEVDSFLAALEDLAFPAVLSILGQG